MMRRIGLVLGALSMTLLFALSLSGCFLFGGPGITGYVYDSFGNAMLNVSVTATDNTGDSYTVSTDSSGKWFVPNPKSGTYTVSASGSGYYFTTPVYGTVFTEGSSVTAPMIAAVSPSAMVNYDLIFVLTWDGSPTNENLHLTMPDATTSNWGSISTAAGDSVDSPTWVPTASGSSELTAWNAGFGPVSGAVGSTRVDCNYANTSPSSGYLVLTGNVQGGGPVTIGMNSAYPLTGGIIATFTSGALFPSSPGTFQGVGMVYVDAPSGNLSTTTSNSEATVYALYNSGSSISSLGAYTIPQGNVLSTMSMIRLNILTGGIQIVPYVASSGPGVFKSVAGSGTSTPQVLFVPRRQH